MNIHKPLLVLGAAAGIGLASVAGVGVASAAANNGSGRDSIIDKLATKFNLNREEVEAVFDEQQAENQAERQQRVENRLDKAVADGNITAEQKAKIIAKLDELRVGHEAWKDKTPEERREARKQSHQQLEQWAKDNDVPLKYLLFVHGHHGHDQHAED